TYIYTIGGTGCSDSSHLTITVDSFRVADAGPNDTICLNEGQISLSGFYPAGGAWTGPGLSDTLGTFVPTTSLIGCNQVTYTYGRGTCNTSDSKFICVDPPPVVSAGPPQAACENDQSLTLTGFSPPGGFWYGPGITNPSSPVFTTTLAGPGTHVLLYVYTDPTTGCSDSSTTTATVYPNPVALFATPPSVCINIPFSPTDYSTGHPTSSLSYSWDFGDGTVSIQPLPSHAYAVPGIYTITLLVADPTGCDSTFSQIITVVGPPQAQFATSDTAGCGPLTVTFTDLSTGFINPNGYYWDFGLGQQTGTTGPHTITYPQGLVTDTTYLVQLVVTNQCGSSLYSDTITVHPTPTADFGTNVSAGCSPLDISFSNTTLGDPTAFYWDLGNGVISTDRNPPMQTYLAISNDSLYTITL
ncbi:MAG: PKD domain-containing protein, partial [Bacteroidota bacterium]